MCDFHWIGSSSGPITKFHQYGSPIVEIVVGLNVSPIRHRKIDVFPTPEFPKRSTLNRASNRFSPVPPPFLAPFDTGFVRAGRKPDGSDGRGVGGIVGGFEGLLGLIFPFPLTMEFGGQDKRLDCISVDDEVMMDRLSLLRYCSSISVDWNFWISIEGDYVYNEISDVRTGSLVL